LAPKKGKRSSRKGGVKQNLTVSTNCRGISDRGKQILELLGAGRPPSAVAEAVGITRSAVSQWIKKLKMLGYLRLLPQSVQGSWNFYELTEKGLLFLTGSEESASVVVLEDYPVKFDVVSWGRADSLCWEKLGEPRNWVKMGFKLGEVRVVRTSKSVIVHPGRLRGDNSWNLVFVASQECNRVAKWLENQVGLVVHTGEPMKKACFQVYDQLSEELTKQFTFKNQDGEGADRSPPARKGHWELGPEAANDFVRMGSNLKRLNNHLFQLEGDLDNLEKGLLPALDAWTKAGETLIRVLNKLGQLEGPDKEPEEKAKVEPVSDESWRYIC